MARASWQDQGRALLPCSVVGLLPLLGINERG
jgi:hypothetical protein